MSTTLVKPAEVERKWYLLDAAGKSLGHVAAEAAVLLRGKQKVDYTPNVDCGDHVIVINCDEAVLTGKKLEKKYKCSIECEYKIDPSLLAGIKVIIQDEVLDNTAVNRLKKMKAASIR